MVIDINKTTMLIVDVSSVLECITKDKINITDPRVVVESLIVRYPYMDSVCHVVNNLPVTDGYFDSLDVVQKVHKYASLLHKCMGRTLTDMELHLYEFIEWVGLDSVLVRIPSST